MGCWMPNAFTYIKSSRLPESQYLGLLHTIQKACDMPIENLPDSYYSVSMGITT